MEVLGTQIVDVVVNSGVRLIMGGGRSEKLIL